MGRDTGMAGGGAGRRAVTAFFDDRAAAQKAVDDLAAAGIARDRITLVEGGADPLAVAPVPSPDKGLWDTVKDLFMADEDRHAYGEGLRRGGFLLSVMTGSSDHARAIEILDQEGAVDMDARQDAWELEGWDPARAAADLRAAAVDAPPRPAAAPTLDDPTEPSVPVGPAFSAAAAPEWGRAVVRDAEAEGLRLRTYVESDVRRGDA